MAEESEKRFHAIMDKLFHAPPKSKSTTTNSTSSSGVQLSRGKKRPNMASALAVLESKSRGDMVEGLQSSLVSGGALQTPLCRPWDRGDLMRRLATFKSMTWFAKPKVVSAVNCARRGWVNVEMDIIACESCGVRLLFSTPSSWTQQQVEKAALVFSLKLDNGHKLLCPWNNNACDEKLAHFPPMPTAVLVDDYKKRSSALLHLLALPVISSSAIDCIRNPQLEHFLNGSSIVECGNKSADTSQTEYLGNECDADSSVSYYQAQKLISLCGWEPRSLPYIVDCKNQQDQSSKDARLSDLSLVVSNGQNPSISVYSSGTNQSVEENDDPMASGGVQSDPNSVVLDCGLCGASVGLWTFSTVPRPAELFRIVGYSEVNGKNGSAHPKKNVICCDGGAHATDGSGNGNHVDNREGIMNTATTGATSSNERPMNLKLTIAGGPPPTNQNFRAKISLPVIGWNLRARISSDSDFRERFCVSTSNDILPFLNYDISEQDDALRNENNCHLSLEVANISGQGFPETSTPDSIMENPVQNPPNFVEGSGKDDELPDSTENIGAVNSAVGDCSCSQVVDPSITTPDADVTIKIGETSEGDRSITVEADNCYLQQNPGTDKVCSAQVDSQDGSGVKAKVQPANNDVPFSIGKNLEQLPLDKAMVFDPIRQHRHFCPWVAPVGSVAPGWQQTLSALQRQKEFSCPLSTNAPSSSSIEVDDPINAVKKLFMSPSKRMKMIDGSR
uniref:C3HC-type domain-containing protein n=1 Tax=Davidia involucrata TaxID=16924 RepID=A0A5B7BCB4_DAVIN